MPWNECSVMDERLRFIARLLEGESMSDLCREAGISRITGYKILGRYKEEGVTAISDRSARWLCFIDERFFPGASEIGSAPQHQRIQAPIFARRNWAGSQPPRQNPNGCRITTAGRSG